MTPDLIYPIVGAIAETKAQYPQLRFGQIIGNAIGENDLYYLGDARLLELLQFALEEYKAKEQK